MIDESKNGFQRLGFIENNKFYGAAIRKLSQQYLDYSKLNMFIDSQWSTKEKSYLIFDDNLKRTDSNSALYLAIDTGYKTPDNKIIYGGFYRKNGIGSIEKGDWKGVTIHTLDGLLNYWELTYSGLASFTLIHENDYSPLAYALSKITGNEISAEDCSLLCQKGYKQAKQNNLIGIYKNSKENFSYFQLPCKSIKGKSLYILMEKSKYQNQQPWFGAFAVTEDDIFERVLDSLCFHTGLLHFDNKQIMLAFLQDISEDAMKEDWTLNDKDTEHLGVLRNYIEYTLNHLMIEDQEATEKNKGAPLKIEEYNGKIYFNSGLLNKLFRQIIIVGEKEQITEDIPVIGKHNFVLIKNPKHFSETDIAISNVFDGVQYKVPAIAKYFTSYQQVVFDAKLPIQLNDYHIFEDGVNRERLPKYSDEWALAKDDPESRNKLLSKISRDFSSALQRARLLAERNYKLAIPQYWLEDNDIQLLLPIYLEEIEDNVRPECALALKKVEVGRAPYYLGTTILDLSMAYNNARLLAKPDVFWLEQSHNEETTKQD